MEFFASYSGSDFLLFYVFMLATCVFLGVWVPALLRPEGRGNSVKDFEEAAVLSGGADRHSSAVLSSLFAKDALDQADKRTLKVTRTEAGETEAERAVLRKVGAFTLNEVKQTVKHHAERIEKTLIGRSLLMDSGERRRLRLLSVLPYAALFAIGLYRYQAGNALGEPTGLLLGLLCLTVLFALIRLMLHNPRTMAGNAALKKLEEQSSRMKRAPQPTEAGFAVALFGTAVLVGTPWEPLHAVQRASSSGGDGGGSSDGDGGGGCGGGCGGCGG